MVTVVKQKGILMYIRSKLKRTAIIAVTAIMTISCVFSQLILTQKPSNSISASAYTDQYDDFLFALGKRESGNKYNIRGGNYLGRWQLGSSALQDAGFMNANGSWTALAKQYGVTSAETFLKSPAAQDYAVYRVHKKIWSYLVSNGASSYVGKNYQGLTVTVAGLVGAAHLVGPYALKKALSSNSSAADGAGTTAYSYMKLLGGYDISATITKSSIVDPTPSQAVTTNNPKETAAVTTAVTTTKKDKLNNSADEDNKSNTAKYDAEWVQANGDLNGDGKINSVDATLLLIYYSETLAGTDEPIDKFIAEYLGLDDEAEETTAIAEETTDITETTSESSTELTEETNESSISADDPMSSIILNNQEASSETEATETTEASETAEPTEATEPEAVKTTLGDLNKDGKVDSIDAIIVLQYYANSLIEDVNPASDSKKTDKKENTTTQTETAATEAVTVAKTDVTNETKADK